MLQACELHMYFSAIVAVNMTQSDPVALFLLNVGENVYAGSCQCYPLTYIIRLYMQICPVCAKRVGTNLVGHITQQHGNILKVSFWCFFIVCLTGI